MHSNKKYSEPHGPHTNNFKIKMVIEILSRRCTENWKRQRGGALGEISKKLHTEEIHICSTGANGQLT